MDVVSQLLCLWDYPGKNTGLGCRAFLQGIFLIQESNPQCLCLLHWQAGSLSPAPPGKPKTMCLSLILSHVWLFVARWTVAHWALLCMESLAFTSEVKVKIAQSV